MPRIRHRVQITHDGPYGKIVVDGTDISDAVRAVTTEGSFGNVAKVTLDLDVIDVTTLDAKDTEVYIPEATAAALVALGWTPPDDG